MGRRFLVRLVAASLVVATTAAAQPVRHVVRGRAEVTAGQGAPNVPVSLVTNDAVVATTTTDADGRFEFVDVASGFYNVEAGTTPLSGRQYVEVSGTSKRDVVVRLGVVLEIDRVIGVVPAIDRPMVHESARDLQDRPLRLHSRALGQALAAAPGWAEEDNGLLHVRGVDDGVLYVEDGIPVYDRIDVAFGIPPALAAAGTVAIATGHTPAQFGLKSGSVVYIDSPPAPRRWQGDVQAGSGSAALGSASVSTGGPLRSGFDIFAATTAERSDRFLDPVHPDNLHNGGGVVAGSVRVRASLARDGQITALARAGRSHYDVPHGEDQDEAGQDQRQRIAQGGVSLAWQQPFTSDAVRAGGYVRRVDARLFGSAVDAPVTATSTRRHDRQGVLASWNRALGRHTVTIGGEAARLALREDFRFAVTDDDADGLSNAARAFTPARPFIFADRVARTQWSGFAQSRAYLGRLTLDTGLRYDHTALLVTASQWSPRVGVAIDLGSAIELRGSFNRFFQPPQAEHLLLSSSEAARALSPFADDEASGGAAIEPERQSAWEAGLSRWFRGVRVDVAGWRRQVRHYADPNVFFGTTIVFPNSVARGTATGLDVRVDSPRRRGWQASASYTLSKIEQEGPIDGGLFLEDDIDELGPGVRFTPDHDQRHVAAATVSWLPAVNRFAATAQARYASGTPLEVGELDDDDLEELLERPGSDLIDVDRGRVKPRLVVDVNASLRIARTRRADLTVTASVLNAFNRRYAFNFGNPFSGTHFGAPRQARADLSATFR